MSKQFSNLVVILFSAFLISACGSSSSSSGSGTVDNVVNDVVDDIANNDTDDNDSDNIDTDSPFVFDPFAQFPDITYTTLDQLPPLVERLNGGPSINPHTIGPVIGSGTYSNANLFRDIPFTIEGEVTEGLVIEKLYAVRNYIVSFLDIDGNKLPNDGFRSDQPEPKIFAIITNLSSIDFCGIFTGEDVLKPFGVQINMKQGGSISPRIHLYVAPGAQFAGLDTDDNRRNCIPSGGSISAYVDTEADKFSEFNEADRYADVEDIESINITSLKGSPKKAVALEPGLVTLNYFENTTPSIFNSYDDRFEHTVVNQSAFPLKTTGGRAYVLDPETLLPLTSFHINNLSDDDGFVIEPGEERTKLTSNTGTILVKGLMDGTSNVIQFVNGYERIYP